ncbi:hypothetical protein MF672_008790 [Actinomadura sp. ATCC 31491]|uniref:Uncharacterized protein n=1 Tax=Actinomadura luzonensis TaxID=2805427 RepID=A0ABT0FPP2_9ACTN|nr:hypothetical protein [Actinomadura luzonensis]MCK2213886.1 hypothetical protein [Actinomadura luzonensis]
MIKSRRGLVAAIVTLASLTLAGVMYFAARQPSSQLDRELSAQVTKILEESSPAEHHAHGHSTVDSAVICAVEPFGTEPANARSLVEVTWVYARHLCAVTGEGTDWAQSVRASGPIAVKISIPPQVRVPEPGPGYQDRVRRLIPERYHAQALHEEFEDESFIDVARERFAEAVQRAK